MSVSLQRDKTLALAAIFQAAGLANELAQRGQTDTIAERALLNSVLILETDNASVIYTELSGLRKGLTLLEGCFMQQGRTLQNAAEIIRLSLAIVQVEKHFRASNKVQDTLRQRLDSVQRQQTLNPDMSQSELSALLGSAYVDSLGSLDFRIQIRGDAKQLQSPGMAERIRAILLAGVRAAWLWQRLGGRRWHLIFTRGQILQEIREIAKTV